MEIFRFESNLLASNMYVIKQNGHAIVIDPFVYSGLDESLVIDKIILTHEHYDHISGVNFFKSQFMTSVLCSKECAVNIQDAQLNMAKYFKQFCKYQTWIKLNYLPEADREYVCIADEVFEDMYSFNWEGHNFTLFELPGHSIGSIGILVDNFHFFSGDSLIEGVDIEASIPLGGIEKWVAITKPRLKKLPDDIIVYPGHFKEFILHKSSYSLFCND